MSTKKFWRVTVYGNKAKLYSELLPRHRFSERRIAELLKYLLSHFVMTPDQIVSATINKKRGAPKFENFFDYASSWNEKESRIEIECGVGRPSFATAVEEFH